MGRREHTSLKMKVSKLAISDATKGQRHNVLSTYTRGQNNWRRRIVKFCNIERLSEEISWVELVERNGSRRLGRLHLIRVGHAHGAKLLGHLRDSRRHRRSVSWSHRLHLGCWIYPVHGLWHGLLVSGNWLLGRVGPIVTTGRQLTSQSRIGTGTEIKSLSSINPLLPTPGLTLNGSPGLSRSAVADRLTIPFLRRVTRRW